MRATAHSPLTVWLAPDTVALSRYHTLSSFDPAQAEGDRVRQPRRTCNTAFMPATRQAGPAERSSIQ